MDERTVANATSATELRFGAEMHDDVIVETSSMVGLLVSLGTHNEHVACLPETHAMLFKQMARFAEVPVHDHVEG